MWVGKLSCSEDETTCTCLNLTSYFHTKPCEEHDMNLLLETRLDIGLGLFQ